MFCSNCGAAEQDGRFCSVCGFQNKGEISPAIKGRHIPYKTKAEPFSTNGSNSNSSYGATGSSTPGFVCSLIGAVFVSVPLICLPLSITGLVLSKKRLNQIGNQQPGSGLAKAGLIIGSIAAAVTTLFMLLAIPGAYEHNFG